MILNTHMYESCSGIDGIIVLRASWSGPKMRLSPRGVSAPTRIYQTSGVSTCTHHVQGALYVRVVWLEIKVSLDVNPVSPDPFECVHPCA